VFDKKGIDPKLYAITFNTAQSVPTKGGTYRDCGMWVCIIFYRLAYNKSLDVLDPDQTALAYREKMAEFFWMYMISVETCCA
jgi:hypothetical protein